MICHPRHHAVTARRILCASSIHESNACAMVQFLFFPDKINTVSQWNVIQKGLPMCPFDLFFLGGGVVVDE